MSCSARKLLKITKLLMAAGAVFSITWIASVSEWRSGNQGMEARGKVNGYSTMKTIVAYSKRKQAELERPSPIACDRLPAYPEINDFNHTWIPNVEYNWSRSWTHVKGRSVSVYSAYYDNRAPQHYVRLLAMFSGENGRDMSSEPLLYCQIRPVNPNDNSVVVVAARPLEIWWHKWDQISQEVETPILLSCPLTEPLLDVSMVSLVTQPCEDPLQAFRIEAATTMSPEYPRTFTICVKDLNFDEDISSNLVEWIEINRILGADIIDVYVDNINKRIGETLEFYRNRGFLRIFNAPKRYAPDKSLWQRRRDHIITYNDCLYRNIRESKFIIPLDIDEVIMPKIAFTWSELLTRLSLKGWNPNENAAILIQNVFFFSFMQSVKKYQYKKLQKRDINDLYIKRDDVRISNVKSLGISEKILENNSINASDVKNLIIDDKNNIMYKSICDNQLPEPMVARYLVRSKLISPIGDYTKSIMVTKKVLTAFNHYPMASFGESQIIGWPAPFKEVQLNHYKESCNVTVVPECALYIRHARPDAVALRLRRRLIAALANGPCLPIK